MDQIKEHILRCIVLNKKQIVVTTMKMIFEYTLHCIHIHAYSNSSDVSLKYTHETYREKINQTLVSSIRRQILRMIPLLTEPLVVLLLLLPRSWPRPVPPQPSGPRRTPLSRPPTDRQQGRRRASSFGLSW